jgi:hypothetical protein
MNKEKIEKLIKWWKEIDTQGMSITEYFFTPLMKALGNDVDEILEYFNEMETDDLELISGIFEDIYDKFMTEDVWNALKVLEKKIESAQIAIK